eukprot:794728-Pelagomonas_calceolata.AAC.7
MDGTKAKETILWACLMSSQVSKEKSRAHALTCWSVKCGFVCKCNLALLAKHVYGAIPNLTVCCQ